jgi:hypothetical protein
MQTQDAKYIYCVDSSAGEPEAFRIRVADNYAEVITGFKNTRRVDDFLRGNERCTIIACELAPTGSVAIPSIGFLSCSCWVCQFG